MFTHNCSSEIKINQACSSTDVHCISSFHTIRNIQVFRPVDQITESNNINLCKTHSVTSESGWMKIDKKWTIQKRNISTLEEVSRTQNSENFIFEIHHKEICSKTPYGIASKGLTFTILKNTWHLKFFN